MARKTGAIASPRNVLAAAFPHRIVDGTPKEWLWLPSKLSTWLNSTYGCCVTTEEAFAKACKGIFIQDGEVQRWASSHGVLNGAVIHDVLVWMQQRGFEQDGNIYSDGPPTSVDYTNPDVLQNAVAQSPVKIGVAASQLQNVVGSGNGWFGLNFRQDGNLDHCISVAGYGELGWLADRFQVSLPTGVTSSQPGYAVFTWDTIGILDWGSFQNITGEAWSRNPSLVQQGNNPVTPDSVWTPEQPTPTPTPNPNPPSPISPLQQAIDAWFAQEESRFANRPRILQALIQAQMRIDAWFAQHPNNGPPPNFDMNLLYGYARYRAGNALTAGPALAGSWWNDLVNGLVVGIQDAQKALPIVLNLLQLVSTFVH